VQTRHIIHLRRTWIITNIKILNALWFWVTFYVTVGRDFIGSPSPKSKPRKEKMWNASFQGKKSGGTHDGHGGNAGPPPASTGNPTATMTDATTTFSTVTGGSSNNSGGVGGGGVPSTIKSANDNNDKSPPPSLPVPSKKKLTAILWPHGNKVTVRVVVNNQIVSAPSSGSSNSSSGAGGAVAEDNEDGTGGGAVKKMMMMRQQQQQHHQDNNAHTNHTTVGSGFDNRGYSGANTTTKTDMSPNNKNSTMMMDQDGMLQQQQQHGNKSFNKQTTEDSMNSTIGSDVDEDDNNNKHHTRRGNDQQQRHCDNSNSINNMAGSSENSSSTSDAVPSSQMPSSATGLNNGSDAGGGGGGSSSNFEASLLLGIAESTSASSNTNNNNTSGIAGLLGTEKEKREPVDPTTLPTSMTSFLDMLTEDQRRVRHRHIPGVDGFRKLYRSEVKSDMSEARKMKRSVVRHHKVQVEVKDTTSGGGGGGSDNGGASAMEVEGENEENKNNSGSAGGATGMSDTTNGKDNGGEKEDETPPPAMRDAFVVPGREVRMCALGGQLAGMIESTDFEFAIKGSNGTTTAATNANNNPLSSSSSSSNNNNNPKDTLRSPRLVDSLTSFNPPRPQESTSSKTKHRLKRWEANPHEVESDLANYRKTVARTREELHNANREHAMIEAGASMMRGHFMEHLMEYRREMTVLRDQMASVTGNCLKLGEEYNVSGGSVSTRGTVKGMKDVLITLKALGEDIKGGVDGSSSEDGSKRGVADVTAAGGSEVPHDWRVEGVGGVRASRALCVALKPSYQEGAKKAASGWLLPGDDVVIVNSGMEGKIAYIHGPEEAMKRSEDAKKKMGKNKMKESAAVKYNDAMDVDSPNKEKKGGMPSTTAANKENSSSKLYTTIGVKLGKSGQFRNYHPSQVRLNVKKFPTMTHTDASLVKRWEDMIKTALPNGVDHDVLAMEHYINSSLVKERNAEEDAAAIVDNGTKDNNDGSGSPKSVTQCGDDDRMLLPFGAGLIAAPQDVKNYPSLIPLDTLEESVRKVVYEADKSRVIPTMSSNRSVRKFEAQQEEMNRLKGKAMQLRNRLGRQKRLRSLNERSLMAGQSRANKVEGLLLEMQMDLKNLKERLQDELNEIDE